MIGGLHYIHLGLYIYTRRRRCFDSRPCRQAAWRRLKSLNSSVHWITGFASEYGTPIMHHLRVDRPEDVPEVAERLQQFEAVRRELQNSGVFFKP